MRFPIDEIRERLAGIPITVESEKTGVKIGITCRICPLRSSPFSHEVLGYLSTAAIRRLEVTEFEETELIDDEGEHFSVPTTRVVIHFGGGRWTGVMDTSGCGATSLLDPDFVMRLSATPAFQKLLRDDGMESAPKVFISYTWETTVHPGHRDWVTDLAGRLRGDGIDVTIDRWSLVPGDELPLFMEQSVRESDFVVFICTPEYKRKTDQRKGGAGYEGDVITGEVYTRSNHRKFVPILRRGSPSDAVPTWAGGKVYVDLSGDPYDETQYERLLSALFKSGEQPPPIGAPRTAA